MNGEQAVSWTVRSLLERASAWLAERGIEGARLDAEWLLAGVLGLRRLDLYLQMDRPVDPAERARYRAWVKRRAQREPLAYIVGEAGFYGLDLFVAPGVLIPRPESEVLLDLAIERLRARPAAAKAVCADIGTGSGAIAVAIARVAAAQCARVIAIDCSEAALHIARRNIARYHLEQRVALVRGDLCTPLGAQRIDLLCANPPYVAERERGRLAPELTFEPPEALFAGPDGFAVLARLLPQVRAVLAPGGRALIEIGAEQGHGACALARRSGFEYVRLHPDLDGRDRVLEVG